MPDYVTREMYQKLLDRIEYLENKANSSSIPMTPTILNGEQIHSRRNLLKYLAAAAGTATIGATALADHDTAFAQTGGENFSVAASSDPHFPAAPTTAGVRYLAIPGSAFTASLSTNNTIKNYDFGTTSTTTGNDFIAGFVLPQGAVITELIAYFNKPNANSTGFYLKRHTLSSINGYTDLFFFTNSSAPTNPNLQELNVQVSGTLQERTVDNANYTYSVIVANLPANHSFKGYRIGYTVPFAGDSFFLATPIRVAASTNSGGSLALLTSNGSGNPATPQTIQISGVVVNALSVPAAAKAIFGSLTSVGATAPGNLRLWPGGATAPTVNSLNIPANVGNANQGFNLTTSFIVGLNATGQVNLAYSNGVNGSTCGFSIDVAGYLI
jgi:hypothetical protein